MGESRNKNSYNVGYFLEFQWQRRVLSESIKEIGDIEYFVLVLLAAMADFNTKHHECLGQLVLWMAC